LVGISKTRFLAADRANADALVDIVRTIFNDAVFQNPGFVIARLKIEIAVIRRRSANWPRMANQT
jgi:hypothetical protein